METPKDYNSYGSHYSEGNLWSKIRRIASKAGIKVIYVVLVLYYALRSSKLSTKDRTIIIGALGYFILPADLIPDFLPGGYVDDWGALIWAAKAVWDNITPDVQAKAKAQLKEWFDNYDKSELDNLW